MKIDHIAIWAENLELLREFYIHYFDMSSSGKYINAKKKFQLLFLVVQGWRSANRAYEHTRQGLSGEQGRSERVGSFFHIGWE